MGGDIVNEDILQGKWSKLKYVYGIIYMYGVRSCNVGIPINVISERFGHANPSITHNIYAHLLSGMGRNAAERFEELLVTLSVTHP
jgi:integrase